jgi:Lactate dehydrogenase and related dehydrogenases
MSDNSRPLKIVFLDRGTIPNYIDLKPLPFRHKFLAYDSTRPEETRSRICDADIVITNKTKLGAADLQCAERLKLIAIAATGSDIVDVEACASRGIGVCNIRNYASVTVPEHTFALIFALRRSLIAYSNAVKVGRWRDSGQFCFFDFPIADLQNSTIGVIGDGALGSATARVATSLGMRVLMAAHKGRSDMGALYTPFEQVLAESDIITLHCPLNDATRHLIGAPEFSRMLRRPIIINTARGGLVDEAALVRALLSGDISGAGFDVVTEEPLPTGHPFEAILEHPGFLLTPHVAWASAQAVRMLSDQLMDNITSFVQGNPTNLITPRLPGRVRS